MKQRRKHSCRRAPLSRRWLDPGTIPVNCLASTLLSRYPTTQTDPPQTLRPSPIPLTALISFPLTRHLGHLVLSSSSLDLLTHTPSAVTGKARAL